MEESFCLRLYHTYSGEDEIFWNVLYMSFWRSENWEGFLDYFLQGILCNPIPSLPPSASFL